MASRLSKNVIPNFYKLHLEPDLQKSTFSGHVDITVDIKKDTSKVEFHSLVNISSYKFSWANSTLSPSEVTTNDSVVSLEFPQSFSAGTQGTLSLTFDGELNDKLVGFYRSKYKVGEESRYMAVTQFEPIDARRAFPCWDDPSFKAVFSISVTAPPDRVAVSNMPVINTAKKGDSTIYHFADSPKMSTYLVCVCVGEYDYVEGVSNDGVKLRVYTVPGKRNQAHIALKAAVDSLEMFTGWFGIKYPLPKLDLLAIPDFSAGAMENWGAITYRETALLVVEGVSSILTIQNACRTIAHEIAHQWFGNLVTMDWWEHLWLNEGFARWAETLCLVSLHPEWGYWRYFVANPYTAALNLDSLLSSHPIEVHVEHEKQINEIFDSISYAKGASVIRMLAAYVGVEKFQKGLHHYLTRHQYQNTLTTDLWSALSEITSQNVGEIMHAWTQVTGYPLVVVQEDVAAAASEASSTKKTFKLTQWRYLRTGKVEASPWQIPLIIRVQGPSHEPIVTRILMKEKEQTITLDIPDGSWVLFNDSFTGLYRVQYPEVYLNRLASQAVETLACSPLERVGIQLDVFALARAGLVSAPTYLSLLKHYRNEDDYFVWSVIISNLSVLEHLFSGLPFASSFRKFVSKFLQPLAQKLGWDALPSDGMYTGTLRSSIISLLAHCEDEATLKEGDVRFKRVLLEGDEAAVVPDLRGTVYKIGVTSGGVDRYELLLKRYFSHSLAEEQRRCLNAVASSTNSQLATRTLDMLLKGEIKAQDMSLIANGVSGSSSDNRNLAWNYTKSNWQEIFAKFGDGLFVFTGFVGGVTSSFVDHKSADEIEAFFKANPAPQAAKTILQNLERIRAAADWIARDANDVQAWLSQNGY